MHSIESKMSQSVSRGENDANVSMQQSLTEEQMDSKNRIAAPLHYLLQFIAQDFVPAGIWTV
jgi:hypothetical protein